MTKQKPQSWKSVVVTTAAIAALVIIECVALSKGINGTLLSAVIAIIAGLGGYNLKSFINK